MNGIPHTTSVPSADPDNPEPVVTEVHRDWVNAGGRTTTGLDDVDFWVGGLAEKQAPFGGLLGPTFNFVFETQMEDLQDGDRFYYLSRTAGLNLLTQLEGNSFVGDDLPHVQRGEPARRRVRPARPHLQPRRAGTHRSDPRRPGHRRLRRVRRCSTRMADRRHDPLQPATST